MHVKNTNKNGSSREKSNGTKHSSFQQGRFLQVAEASLGTLEVQISEKRLDSSFPETRAAHLYTSPHLHAPMVRTAIKCVSAGRAHAARGTQTASAECFVQVLEAIFRPLEVQSSEKN